MLACRCKERDGPVINWRALAKLVPRLPAPETRRLWREVRRRSPRCEHGSLDTLSAMHLGLVQYVAGLYVSQDLARVQADECLERFVRAGAVGFEQALVKFCRRPRRRQRDLVHFSVPFIQRAIKEVLAEEGCCDTTIG